MAFEVYTVTAKDETLANLQAENERLRRERDGHAAEYLRVKADLIATQHQLRSAEQASAVHNCDVSNALVHQKNTILEMLNSGEQDAEALDLLNFAEELWKAAGYAYKTAEVRNRLVEKLKDDCFRCSGSEWRRREKLQALLARAQGYTEAVAVVAE